MFSENPRNLLVCGATKQGKTNYLKGQIDSLLADESPDVEIIIIDSKRAGEYDVYADKALIIKRFIEIKSTLTALHGKVLSRIDGEPEDRKIILVIDEYSDLIPGEYTPERAKAILECTRDAVLALAKEGPANGLCIFLATNQLYSSVLPDELMVCFQQRACFRVISKEQSDLIFPGLAEGAEQLKRDQVMVQDSLVDERVRLFSVSAPGNWPE